MTKTLLPPFNNNATTPQKCTVLLPTHNGDKLRLDNTILLGNESSKRETHYQHEGKEFAPSQKRCSACRWFEVSLYRTPVDYVVWTCGHTIVPGESSRINIHRTDNEFYALELLTVRKLGTAFLPAQSALVLASGAKYDSGIQDAYLNRAVS